MAAGKEVREPRETKAAFWLIFLAAFLLRFLFVINTPAWQAPDEYPHFWVAEQIAKHNQLPVSKPVFPAYEAYQPPLYYVAAALILKAVPGDDPFTEVVKRPSGRLLLLRLFSLTIGMITLWFAFRIFTGLTALTPTDRLAALAIMAFLPSYVYVTATVSNDALVVLFTTVSLYYLLKDTWQPKTPFVAGLWLGIAILTKLNAIVVLPVLLFRTWKMRDGEPRQKAAGCLAGLVGSGLSLAVLWVRNSLQYGEILAINPGLATSFSFSLSHLVHALRNLSWSFWLGFGRIYEITPHFFVYLMTALPLMLLAMAGWHRAPERSGPLFKTAWVAIVAAILGSLFYTLSYPAGTMTSWGKNLFPVISIIALFLSVGWGRLPQRSTQAVTFAAILLMILGSLWGLRQLTSLAGG